VTISPSSGQFHDVLLRSRSMEHNTIHLFFKVVYLDLRLAGNGAKEIAKKLNNDGISTKKGGWWTKASVQYVLKNTVYTGDLVWPKEKQLRRGEEQVVIKDHHPPIISGDAFRQAQSLISERSFERTHPKQVASSYLFSGLLYREKCGKAMQGGTAKSGQYRYYGCYSRSRISTSSCDCKAINCERMEIAVIDRLQSHVLTDEHLAELLHLTNTELAAQSSVTVKQIEALQRQLDVKEKNSASCMMLLRKDISHPLTLRQD
jgi:hypothetical protein